MRIYKFKGEYTKLKDFDLEAYLKKFGIYLIASSIAGVLIGEIINLLVNIHIAD